MGLIWEVSKDYLIKIVKAEREEIQLLWKQFVVENNKERLIKKSIKEV